MMCSDCAQFAAALRASDAECFALKAQLAAVSKVLYGLADVIDPWVGDVLELEEAV